MYLSKIIIKNYKGIQDLEVKFNSSMNVIIGENGSCKSALIDAIRLLYNIGNPQKDIAISNEDFYENPTTGDRVDRIELAYEFRGLTVEQKGALYECMILAEGEEEEDYAKVSLVYENTGKKYPSFSYSTGIADGQKAEYKTFEVFQHYYLGALRDSTKDLLNSRNNILGNVIKRKVERAETESEFEAIIIEANNALLARPEVLSTRSSVNENLERIIKNSSDNKIGLMVEQAKIEYIVNVIKPFLPHDKETLACDKGFNLWQNSLGLNNLIYTATVLGDIKERITDDNISHFALLIEEPEAHLHPQLQLCLYNFLKEANGSINSQLFITTHSPTLTSKVPFENLILLDKKALQINDCFTGRESENIVEDASTPRIKLNKVGFENRKKQLIRYIDVTKSQLFFAKSILMVEGISEELLINPFGQVLGFNLEDFHIETININGVSFYPFMYLFNSTDVYKRIEKRVAILTDDDRCSDAKTYSFKDLIESKLDELILKLKAPFESGRIKNIESVINSSSNIVVKNSFKTFELELALSNVAQTKQEVYENFFVKYISSIEPTDYAKIKTFIEQLPNSTLTEDDKLKIAVLLWKIMPSKAEFAQDFSIHILENIDDARASFKVPQYIIDALNHIIQP